MRIALAPIRVQKKEVVPIRQTGRSQWCRDPSETATRVNFIFLSYLVCYPVSPRMDYFHGRS